VIAVAIVVVAGLFIVLSGDDDEPATTTTAASTTTSTQEPGGGPEKPEKPEVPTIVVKDGEPVGGVAELSFTTGEDIRFNVQSDEEAEVHFHGYDVAEDVQAGGRVQFDVPADIEGVFELELEETTTQIAEITVAPG
jgi:hypothetical protein